MNDTSSNIDEPRTDKVKQPRTNARTGGSHPPVGGILSTLRIVLAMVGLLGAVSSGMMVWLTQQTYESGVRVDTTSAELAAVRVDIAGVRNETKNIVSQIDAITGLPDDAKIGLRLTGVEQQMSTLQTTIDIIETAVVDNPERAMSIPVLRKDLEALSSEVHGDIGGLGKEIERLYTFGQWFIGAAMIPIALAVFTMTVGMRLRSKE